MEIRVNNDSVEIVGYVNAIERNSKPLYSRMGQFVERVCKGAFKKALHRATNVEMLLNHNPERVLANTRDGSLELTEDNIGLLARATVTDKDVVEDARNGNLVGWSFGFEDVDVERSIDEDTGLPLRKLRDLVLHEVSVLNREKTPAYDGTLVTCRSDDSMLYRSDVFEDALAPKREEIGSNESENGSNEEIKSNLGDSESKPLQAEPEAHKSIDYSKFENMIKEMKGEI